MSQSFVLSEIFLLYVAQFFPGKDHFLVLCVVRKHKKKI